MVTEARIWKNEFSQSCNCSSVPHNYCSKKKLSRVSQLHKAWNNTLLPPVQHYLDVPSIYSLCRARLDWRNLIGKLKELEMEEKNWFERLEQRIRSNPFLWNTVASKQLHRKEKIQSDPLFCFLLRKPEAARVRRGGKKRVVVSTHICLNLMIPMLRIPAFQTV